MRIRLLPNTAPVSYVPMAQQDAPECASIVPQDGFCLMFAGNIGENQDFDTLIAAAGLLRARHALRWVIVGSGCDQACAQKVIADSEEGARIIEGPRPDSPFRLVGPKSLPMPWRV